MKYLVESRIDHMKYFSVSLLMIFESAAAATIPRAMFYGLSEKMLKNLSPYSSTSMIEA
jgi:hypothetical protein